MPTSVPHHRIYVLSLTSVNLFARGAYFLVFLGIGNLYGATDLTDIVFLLYAPIAVLCTVVAGVGEVVLIPLAYQAASRHCLNVFLSQLLRRGTVLALAIGPVAALASFLVAGRVSALVLLLLPIPVLAVLSAVFSSYLVAHQRFRSAALSPVFGAIAAALVLLLSPQSAWSLSTAFLAYEGGRALSLFVQVLAVRTPDRQSHGCDTQTMLAAAFSRSWLQAVGSLLVALNPVVDMLFAKGLGAGAVSSIEYANRIWIIVPLLFSGALMLTHARLSGAASEGRLDVHDVHRHAARLAIVALVASGAIAILVSLWAIDWIFGFGQMDDASRETVAHVLVAYLAGAAPYIAGLVYIRAFSAVGDVAHITKSAMLSVVANVVLDALLVGPFGAVGLGIATALCYYLVAAYLFACAHQIESGTGNQDAV